MTFDDLPPMIRSNRPRRDRKDILYVFLFLLLVVILIFGRVILPRMIVDLKIF